VSVQCWGREPKATIGELVQVRRGRVRGCAADVRYLGTDTDGGFALYQASSETYDDSVLPSGQPIRHPRTGPRLRPQPLPRRSQHLDQPSEGLMRCNPERRRLGPPSG
jgi:hypothetical protein